MEMTRNYLEVLSESLDKKLTILGELVTLTEEQGTIASAGAFDEERFNAIVHQKSTLIEELEKLDEGFQTLYDRIKEQLEQDKEQYRDEIELLRTKIRRVTDLSTGLMSMERRNQPAIAARFREAKKEVRQVKRTRAMAANYYKAQNKISEEPYFVDRKK